ncbi:MAG: endonuclease domain-containing protein [Phycisphaerales bacterium]|nr:endonuclease domain-containing protein [Hyphomonadaceae bacterium]
MREDLTGDGVSARFKSDRAVGMARGLRKRMTPAEKALWHELRRLTLPGTHFRKQAPVGPFIADFACWKAKLVIELEGGAHNAPDVAANDAERRAWLEGRGLRVLRISNADVLKNAHAAARYVEAAAIARLSTE